MTSIEWLETHLINEYTPICDYIKKAIEQAKEMHKQEIIDAWQEGYGGDEDYFNANEYYQETFKKG